jgi:probable selenium-dependent hydroxylase accessory protein YqeC
MADFESLVERLFPPGRISTLTGAGGKSTAMRVIARTLARKGIRTCMTTTTRVGKEEFAGFPVVFAHSADRAAEALCNARPVRLVVSAEIPGQGKYKGLEPSVFDSVPVGADMVVLVEGDGSRRAPLKVPREGEPVVPAASAAVFALLGAAGFGERVEEAHCYNHEAARGILPPGTAVFTAAALAALANHPAGCRKGVLPGMELHVLLNQGDLESKRPIGVEVFRILAEVPGIRVSLLSLQGEVVYETTEI